MQERSPRSEGNKYKRKIRCWTSRSLWIEQAPESLPSGGKRCYLGLFSASGADNYFGQKGFFSHLSVSHYVVWFFVPVNLWCLPKVRASGVIRFSRCGESIECSSSAAAPQLIQTAAEPLKLQGWLPNWFYLPLLSQGWVVGINTIMILFQMASPYHLIF